MLALAKRHLKRSPKMWSATVQARDALQRGVWFVLDAGETLVGRKDPLTPPRRLMNVGSNGFTRSDFNAIGQQLFQRLVAIGGIKPYDKVLDVGCGVGRMAIPLTRYLSSAGTYDGFDIVAESIEHCTKAFAAHADRFHFHHADLFNSTYNPAGKYLSHQYRFPFPDQTFSFVLLTSVFTHILNDGVENYLNEIRRVLAPGGRCFITFFILNEESETAMRANRSSLKFDYDIDRGKSTHLDTPEAAVAFDEPYIRDIYLKCGLRIVEPIRYGSWSGKNSDAGYQDVIVACKGEENEPRAERDQDGASSR